MKNITVTGIVLAAGQGVIDQQDPTKLVADMQGVPLLRRPAQLMVNLGIELHVVVSREFHFPAVNALEGLCQYNQVVIQKRQMGTANAVNTCLPLLNNCKQQHVLVLYGDTPYWQAKSIRKLMSHHSAVRSTITMFRTGSNQSPFSYDQWGKITGIREFDDPSIGPSAWVFNLAWLRRHSSLLLSSRQDDNHDYQCRLLDLVPMAASQHQANVAEVDLSDPREALRVRNLEGLKFATGT